MAEFASNAKANTGVALAGSSLGLSLLGGGLNWLFGGNRSCCNEDHFVNRYDMKKEQEITKLETENSLLKSNIYTDQKLADVYERLDAKIRANEASIAQQAVFNAGVNSNLSCIQGQIAQLAGLTKLVIPTTSVCPEPMPLKNSWTAPTAGATA